MRDILVGVTTAVVILLLSLVLNSIIKLDRTLAVHIERAEIFMKAGERFTSVDGEVLEARVDVIGNRVTVLEKKHQNTALH